MSLDKSQALNAANQYVLQRNVHAAVEIYRRIIESDPTDLTTMNTLGELYAGAGRVQDAIAQFSRVAALYAEGGLTRKAIATLEKVIAVEPSNIESAITLADLYAQAGLPSEARHHYIQIAEALTRKGQTLDALMVYNKLVDLDPSNTSGRIKLGELYLREGMNEQAFEAFLTAADQLAAGSENRRALNAYKEALAIRPDSVEVKEAALKVSALLGLADPGHTSRNSSSQGAAPRDLANAGPPTPVASGPAAAPSSFDKAPQGADSFVIQEISKAEILVAYGQVKHAIAMLKDVLREQPDSIDLHIKLKDIYLRTGMIAEAAYECVELERIHGARGESERARDYAVRASRLTQLLEQPSGDLPESTHKPVPEAETRVVAVPAKVAPPQPHAPSPDPAVRRLETRPVAEPARITISVVPTESLPVKVVPEPASDLRSASQSSSAEALVPLNSAEAELVDTQKPESALALRNDTIERALPVLVASSMPVKRRRSRFTAVAVAGVVFVLLGVSAVIGGLAYDDHLDKQYQTLALASPPLALPLPPPVFVSDEPSPSQENEPISVVVKPSVQIEPPAEPPSRQPAANRNDAGPSPQPVSEPPKATTLPPPRVAFTPESRAATEDRTPVGVLVDVPSGLPHPAEPPPGAVRRSPGVVQGGAVQKVDPVYPAAAKQARQAGAVTVEVVVNEQGNVTSARALSGPVSLRDAAVGAARAWKFRPSTLGGVPVRTTTTIVFNFKL